MPDVAVRRLQAECDAIEAEYIALKALFDHHQLIAQCFVLTADACPGFMTLLSRSTQPRFRQSTRVGRCMHVCIEAGTIVEEGRREEGRMMVSRITRCYNSTRPAPRVCRSCGGTAGCARSWRAHCQFACVFSQPACSHAPPPLVSNRSSSSEEGNEGLDLV